VNRERIFAKLMRATSWASHIAATGSTDRPDLAARLDFRREFERFQAANEADGRLPARWDERSPQLQDRTLSVPYEPHYLLHPAWAARCLARIAPERHVDVSSYLPFVTMISAFVEVEYYEFRPTPLPSLAGITSRQADLTQLPFEDASIPSLSCLHVVEHLGLGRYGDPLDPGADLRALGELARVLSPGGDLLLATPVGEPRVRFNAHRVYSLDMVLEALPDLELVEFALIPEQAAELLTGEEAIARVPEQRNTVNAGTGCFWFRKPR
jgi:hypothetical protein